MYCPRCRRQFGAKRAFCLDCGARLLRAVSLDTYRSKDTGQAGAIYAHRYALHGFMGKGTTARVYLAEDLKTKELVAVKLLATASVDAKKRFLREAKAAMAIDHPNVLKVIDVGERADGVPFLVVELLHGETLGAYVRRAGAVPIDVALTVLRQAAAGLGAAHRAGVIHRDVKPDNLFLVGEVGEPFGLKLIDFGLAKVKRSTASSSGVILGTIEYMSPEQVLTDPTDARSDVYGLGSVMFRIITGQLPFDAKRDVNLLAHQLFTPLPPPSSIKLDIDPRVERVIVKATRKHPDNRYQSMDGFEEDLERLLGLRAGDPAGLELARVPDRYEPKTEFSKAAADLLEGKLAR